MPKVHVLDRAPLEERRVSEIQSLTQVSLGRVAVLPSEDINCIVLQHHIMVQAFVRLVKNPIPPREKFMATSQSHTTLS